MFGLITFDRKTFLIVKKESIKDDGMPVEVPFKAYGFMYRQEANGKVMFSLITKSKEVEKETMSLVHQAQELKPVLNGAFYI